MFKFGIETAELQLETCPIFEFAFAQDPEDDDLDFWIGLSWQKDLKYRNNL